MSTFFAHNFRELVMPSLRRRCRVAAFCLERGQWSFSEASAFVWSLAHARGASHLPNAVLFDLAQWIDSQILSASIEFEAPDKRREIIDELVAEAVAA